MTPHRSFSSAESLGHRERADGDSAAHLEQRIAALRTEVSVAERERHGITPALLAEAGTRAAQRDADCTMVNARAGITDTAKETIMAAVHAETMRAADIVQLEAYA